MTGSEACAGDCAGTCTNVSAFLPYLLAISIAPFGIALLLFVATRLEASLPRDKADALAPKHV